jgi:hypothetical protein
MPRQSRWDALGILQHVVVKGLEGKEIFLRGGPKGLAKYLRRL